MSDATPNEQIVEGILAGRAAENVRTAAARGALPIPRVSLVRLQIALLEDADEGIRAAAKASLEGLEGDDLRDVLGDEHCAPEVLIHFSKPAARDESLAERIAFHSHVPTAALGVLASAGSASVIELVLTNQERLLAQPLLLDRLMLNPALRVDQQGRILELLDRASKMADEKDGEDGPGPLGETTEEDYEELARVLDVDVGELLSASEILGAEELEHSDDEDIRGIFQKIVTLNSAQKAIMAMKGGREERLILVRDTNKVVALGVLKNPRITENEIEAISRMRNVTAEVLRGIGNTRDWIKKYPIVQSLVFNPRTPQQVSCNFISRLTNKDLKTLSGSREVPELVRRMARKTHDLRTQRAKSKIGKH